MKLMIRRRKNASWWLRSGSKLEHDNVKLSCISVATGKIDGFATLYTFFSSACCMI